MGAPSALLLAAALQGVPAPRADTVPPPVAVERSVTIKRGAVELAGTLTLPRDVRRPVPLAVIIAGSGPTDRNGNSALGLRTNVYAQLAWRLAERGIATLRYDKRGLGASRGAVDIAQTTIDDFAADARAAADTLSRDGRFSLVAFVGHSEGATLAVRAANAGAPVRGVALLAGLGRPFLVVLREQLGRQLDSATLVRYDSAMARYLGTGEVGDVPAALGVLFVPVNRTFMRSLAAVDPPGEVARLEQPVLIVQGGNDVQVAVEDAELLHGARPAATFLVIPEANHVFKRAVSRDLAAQRALYLDPAVPVAPELVDALAAWIGGLRP